MKLNGKDRLNTASDLLFIFFITAIPITIIMNAGQKNILDITSGLPLLIKIIYNSLIQFSISGLGIVLVMLFRKEKFSDYYIKKSNILKSIISGCILIIIFLIIEYISQGTIAYMPFKTVYLSNEIIHSVFPVNITGLLLIAAVWGFFESFNYVYISKKINKLVNIKIPFLRPGPILMGISCILVHGALGHGILGLISSFFVIYFMLLIPEFTGNAWGCILIFIFYWNAV